MEHVAEQVLEVAYQVCQNPRFRVPPAAVKTCRLASSNLWFAAVPESTLSGTQRSGLTHGERLEISLRNLWREAFILTVWS
jgi:hypothetical protein